MTQRLVIDPVTRIEGHLRLEVELEGNRIASAYSSGTSVRGIEIILQGRDPRDAWAFAQRICGVCTLVHGVASIRAVEDALRRGWAAGSEIGGGGMAHGIPPAGFPGATPGGPEGQRRGPPAGAASRGRGSRMGPPPGVGPRMSREHGHGVALSAADIANADKAIPPNAQLIRNLMIGAQYIHDHVMHFYHLHALDWVDVVSAIKADPQKASALATSISSHPKSSPGYFSDVRNRLKTLAESGQLGIFANAYWGHSGYKLPPEANLMAVAHYLEALEWQREVAKLHTIFGGKNPHPNFVVGGVPSPIDLESDSAINASSLARVQAIIDQMRVFVEQVYLPDTLAIASFYRDWATRGEGLGNFLTVGDLPMDGIDTPESFFFPRGIILGRDLGTVHPLDLEDTDGIQEFVARSWYRYAGGKETGLHPWSGETNLDYTGPQPPYSHLDIDGSYSWLKSPRWRGMPMEVGPLARVLVMYATGHEATRTIVGDALGRLELTERALFSTLGRVLARSVETRLLADAMQDWFDRLVGNIKNGDTRTFNELYFEPRNWPRSARGVGFMEAPRGALTHWIDIRNSTIANYQCVVPSTWNAGPRDASGQPGAYEAALQDNHELIDPDAPLEILRTIHSFDPCLACAVHVLDEHGKERVTVKVR